MDSWSDYELRHEFDSPVLTKTELLTRANIGEVAPDANSPLSTSITGRIGDHLFQANWKRMASSLSETNPWVNGRVLASWEHHSFLNVINGFHRYVQPEISNMDRAIDMGVFGRV